MIMQAASVFSEVGVGLICELSWLLPDSGYLHKVVLLETEAHIIEEVQVFRQPQPIKNMQLSASKVCVCVFYIFGFLHFLQTDKSKRPINTCSGMR